MGALISRGEKMQVCFCSPCVQMLQLTRFLGFVHPVADQEQDGVSMEQGNTTLGFRQTIKLCFLFVLKVIQEHKENGSND